MAGRIIIGKSGRQNIEIDLETFLKTRALIQAGSGAGKSWLLRRLAEQLFGKVQTIIIDREGEFASLREKYGFVLAGHDGDTPTDIRSARLLAEKFLELRASAVCDLYEAFRKKPRDRQAWVRGFLEGLMDAPKKFWRQLVVIVDEAHLFAPQESPKAANMIEREIISGCKDAMMSLATAGRKRGFCAVWATQRLAKLDKDGTAELYNRFVGQTIEDVDVDRAADLMSVSREEKAGFKKTIKNLEPGDFFGFGRAVSKDRILIRVGPVKTTHPESGSSKYAAAPPPAPEKIRGLLPKLKDLPGEVEQKARTEADLKKEIRELQVKLKTAERTAARPAPTKTVQTPAPAPVIKTKIREVPALKKDEIKKLEKLVSRVEKAKSDLGFTTQSMEIAANGISAALARSTEAAEDAKKAASATARKSIPNFVTPPMRRKPFTPAPAPTLSGNGVDLLAGERKMLTVLAQIHPGSRTKSQLGTLAGYAPRGGTFMNYFRRLKKEGFIREGMLKEIFITDEGLQAFGGDLPQTPQTADERIAMWREKLTTGERKLLDVLVQHYPNAISKEELGEQTGYASTGGTFMNYLRTVRRVQIAVVEGDTVKAADSLFEQ
jgi:hypothetical protein